jgi:hypothetical protein
MRANGDQAGRWRSGASPPSLHSALGNKPFSIVKASVWLMTLSLAIVSITWGAIAHVVVVSLQTTHRGLPVPNLTAWMLVPHHWWILWCPAPWAFCASVLSARRELSASAALVFAGSVAVAAALLVGCVATACVLPYTMLIDF